MKLRTVAAAAAVAGLVLAACGSDDNSSSGDTTAGSTAGTEAAGSAAPAGTAAAGGGDCVVGVSWNNFQEERWGKFDEPAIKAAIEAGGGSYVSNDAKSSAETQASNVENLISQGANVVVILAQDGTAIIPSVQAATAAGLLETSEGMICAASPAAGAPHEVFVLSPDEGAKPGQRVH